MTSTDVNVYLKNLSFWNHISDDDKRHFYEIECSKAKWSARELKWQMVSSLFGCMQMPELHQ